MGAVSVPAQILLRGELRDPLWLKSTQDSLKTPGPTDTLDLVVLESGYSTPVLWGRAFEIPVPMDSTWNLCVLSANQERCYVVRANYGDTLISGVLLDDSKKVFYSDSYLEELEQKFAAAPNQNANDSLLLALSQSTEANNQASAEVEQGMTKLRKVVLNIKKRPKRALGQSTVSAKNIKRLPGLAEADVVKAIQALPGVVASSDFSSKIYVRGGGADQNLFLFDKAPVYSPVHFFGLFSTFLVEGVDKVDFYKGGFSPQFGNRLSSVVDVQTRRGGADSVDTAWWKWNTREVLQETGALVTNSLVAGTKVVLPGVSLLLPQKWEDAWDNCCFNDSTLDQFGGSVLVSTFASTLHLQGNNGPVRFQAAGRSTYLKQVLGLLRDIGATDIDIDYGFYDLQGAVDYAQGPDQWRFSFYQGQDRLIFSPLEVEWGNVAIPLNYQRNLSEKSDIGATLSYSSFNQTFDLQNIVGLENGISTYTFKPWWKYRSSNTIDWLFGSEFQYNDVVFINEQKVLTQEGEGDSTDRTVRLQDGGYYGLYSPYAELKWTPEDSKWNYSFGLRANYQQPLNDVSLEPRVSATWRFAEDQKLDLHTGMYYQYVNSILFGTFESINEFYYPSKTTKFNRIEPSKSLLFSAGWTKEKWLGEFDITVEGFYKTLDQLISFLPNEAGDDVRSDPGVKLGDFLKPSEGYSYGLELSGRRNAGALSGGASYSYSVAVLNEADKVFYANWDKRHSGKVDMAINWKGEDGLWAYTKPKPKGSYFRSSIGISMTSGLPTTGPLGYYESHLYQQGEGDEAGGPNPGFNENVAVPEGSRNGQRYPYYFRWDLKAVDWGVENKWNFSWTILNISNRENVFLYSYDRSTSPPQRTVTPQFPFFPLLLSYQRYF
jgi:hypothetical protein